MALSRSPFLASASLALAGMLFPNLADGALAQQARSAQTPEPPSAAPAPEGTPRAAPAPARAPRQPRSAATNAERSRALWWNDTKTATALALTQAQRSKADALLESHLAKRSGPTNEDVMALRESLAAALAAGDAGKARAAATSMGELRNRPYVDQVELMIGVLALLDDSQRAKLASDYPQLLRQPWIRQTRLAGGGPRQRGQQ